MSYIKIRNLNFSYKDDEGNPESVLRDLSLDIEKGEYVAVLGHNGSGKSTLAKLLNLVIDDYDYFEGSIEIDGVEISSPDMTEDDIYELRKKVGMVFQNPDNQIVATIVEEDVAFGPENLGVPREEIRLRVDEALRTVGMTEYARHEPHRLSGGQKQRIAIAGIIAMRPECIIFDESTAMLDPMGRREVVDTMEKLNREEGKTIITITHYMDEAVRADRVVVIDDGRIILDGKPSEIFAEADKLRECGLDLPQCSDLILRLRSRGIEIEGDINTPEQCAEAIFKAFDKR
ncbi:MAG: energy-coupling factor transporter ATPase [Clostridia bacterium]|nr:energy-coupling factor transporter ATPase [Clostridia bacterium]